MLQSGKKKNLVCELQSHFCFENCMVEPNMKASREN